MYKKLQPLFIPVIVFVFFFGCEDFQKKDFKVEGLDKQASTIFTDTTIVPVSIISKDITSIDTTWKGSNVTNNVSVILDTLNKGNITLVSGNDLYSVGVPSDTTYLAISTDAARVIIYSTNYVRTSVINDNGQIIDPESLNFKMELVYESPDVKVRAEYNGLSAMSLLKIVKGEQFDGSSMKVLLLKN